MVNDSAVVLLLNNYLACHRSARNIVLALALRSSHAHTRIEGVWFARAHHNAFTV